ncbi:MAG: tetratricopeptide repeat protein [Planctomycetota bacterium]
MQWTATIIRSTSFACLLCLVTGTGHAQFRDVTPGRESEEVEPRLEPTPMQEVEPNTFVEPGQRVSSDTSEAVEVEAFGDDLAEGGFEQLDESLLVDDTEIRPLTFRGVLVGETTEPELLEKWGEPYKTVVKAGTRTVKFRVEPFRQVDVSVKDSIVSSILIHIDGVLDPQHIATELRMTKINPVPVPDQFGMVLGLSFPERGVLFGFDGTEPDSLVSKIHLEPINPEPFVLRAEYDFDRNYEQDFADLETAISMNPRYARAMAIQCRKLVELGRYHDAIEAINAAINYDADALEYRITKARLMLINGNREAARREIVRIREQDQVPDQIRAATELVMGDLLAEGSVNKIKAAMQHHLKAIEIAAPIANDERFQVRRMAKELLIDAHLAVARDVSLGEFQRQEEVVPKWLSRARALVEEYIQRDQGDPALRLAVYQQILATAADLRNPDDPQRVIDELIEEGRRQISLAEDIQNQGRIEWALGAALTEAIRLQRMRGEDGNALQLADDALILLQQSARMRQSTPRQRYRVGRLYFHIGSLHAVQRNDHREALVWYKKADPLLTDEAPIATMADLGTHGEMFVSIGVSYWETGAKQVAIGLTERGTDVLQKAVVDGELQVSSLAIPYGNLASMHQQAGNTAEAEAFTELASSVVDEAGDETTTR